MSGTIKNATGISDAYSKALTLIAGFEGFRSHAYPDADGFSIGYGHFIRPDDPYDSSSIINEAEAYALLEQDVRSAQICVSQKVTTQLTDNQTAALISFVYNVGCGAFGSSTLLRYINEGNFSAAAGEFARWNRSNGQVLQSLINRRASESEVFSS